MKTQDYLQLKAFIVQKYKKFDNLQFFVLVLIMLQFCIVLAFSFAEAKAAIDGLEKLFLIYKEVVPFVMSLLILFSTASVILLLFIGKRLESKKTELQNLDKLYKNGFDFDTTAKELGFLPNK